MKIWITCESEFGDSAYTIFTEKPEYSEEKGTFFLPKGSKGKSAEVTYGIELLIGENRKFGECVEMEINEIGKSYWEQINSTQEGMV